MATPGRYLQGRRVGLAILLVVAVLTVISGLAYFGGTQRADPPPEGVVRVAPAPVAPPVVQMTPPSPTPLPLPLPSPTPAPPVRLDVDRDVLAALKLPSTAVIKGTTLHDADDRVICGEVARSRADTDFRRFVYIAESKAGFVDDGGPVFRQIHATTCETIR